MATVDDGMALAAGGEEEDPPRRALLAVPTGGDARGFRRNRSPAAVGHDSALIHRAHNLLVPLTNFVGREREIAEIRRRLPATRLLTLSGAPGVGKTRLALQVASEVLGAYEDGVWLVDLAPLSDPTLVEQVIAAALGVYDQAGSGLSDALADALRTRRLLLVLAERSR